MPSYALEQLFVDQNPDLVHDTIGPVLPWVPGKTKAPFAFQVDHSLPPSPRATTTIELGWDISKLAVLTPGVQAHAKRLKEGASAQREHVTELAAYGLAFVAISTLMPGVKVLAFRRGLAPDLLVDISPGALRGVEVAGRRKRGASALRQIRDGTPATSTKAATVGKAAQLQARADVVEAYLALFCASPRVALQERVKP